MVKAERLIKKYSMVLDTIILILCSFLVINSILETSVLDAPYASIDQDVIYKIMLVLAVIKLFACFSIHNQKVVGATALLFAALIARQLGFADCTFIIIPMVALYGVNFRVVARVFTSSSVFGLLVVLIMSLTGIIRNISIERTGSVRGDAYQVGFSHHSWFMMYWLFVVFALLYLYKNNKFRVILFMVLQLISVIMWLVTDSNTSGIIGILMCAILIIDYLIHVAVRSTGPGMRKVQNALLKASIFIPIIAVIITIIGCVCFGYFGYRFLPDTFLSRFNLIDTALEALGVPLPFSVTEQRWDIPYNWLTGVGYELNVIEDYILDNVYGKLFIEYGFLMFAAYIALQLNVRYKLYKSRQYVLALICSAISLFGILEPRAFTHIPCALFSMLLFTRIPVKKVRKKVKRSRQ